jgi:hypothetical protein
MGAFGRGNLYRTGYDEGQRPDQTMQQFQARRGAYIIVGLLLAGLGILVDWLL